jgi:hypothetical protein
VALRTWFDGPLRSVSNRNLFVYLDAHWGEPDERVTLAHDVHRLKEIHGPRLTAHWLYHAARTLTLEADRAAMAEAERHDKQGATPPREFTLVFRVKPGVDPWRAIKGLLKVALRRFGLVLVGIQNVRGRAWELIIHHPEFHRPVKSALARFCG